MDLIPCKRLVNFVDNMLSNRCFQVELDSDKSKWKRLNNGLPLGSVLAPTLFNLYLYDLPLTSSQKLFFADDLALVYQCNDFEETELFLTADLNIMKNYYGDWRL